MKRFQRSVAIFLAGALLSAPAFAADYTIDNEGAHASINFRIKHLGYSWLTGRFDKFNGTFSYDEAKPEASKVSVTIDTASVNSNHGKRDKHLRGGDFLDVEMFPQATFTSKSVTPGADGKLTIVGDLTLHGETKEVSIDAEVVGSGKDPWGGYRTGFSGTTKLKLADFGIDFNLGPASTHVELDLNVEGIRK
ncbi:MAG: YceI family protein [Alphaproteobacteria bacterium]|nr:YceI family protein [Alphaproteobacteria bacterium]